MNKLVPKLRFPTPLMPYQRFRFGDLVSIKSNKFNPVTESFLYPCIELEHISQGTGILLGSVASDKVASQKNKFGAGDILFSKLRPYLKKYAMPTFEGICSSEIWVMKPNSDLERSYLYQYIQTDKFIYEANKSSGSKMPRSDWGVVSELNFYCPPKSEQQKIANFLASVDTKISQLTEKHRLLKDYKKGVIQQVFSQQIRFKDGDGNAFPEWEEKTLRSLFDWIRTNNLSREKLSDNVTALQNIHYGDIHTKYHSQFVQTRENIPYVVDVEIDKLISQADFCKNGDIVIADASEDYADIGKAIEIINVKEGTLVAGLHTYIARPKNKFASGFLGYLFQFNGTRRQVQKLAQGVSVLGISKGNIETTKLSVPHIDEQQKIAGFLQSLDKKIDAVNEQIEHTKLFKKGLLQQMFV